MGVKQTIDYNPTEMMVEEGRKALGDGRLDDARLAFEEVLRRQPDHPRALLGLAYVTRQSAPPPGGAEVLQSDLEIVTLVREKRHVEALELLQRSRLVRPDDLTIQKSITHIEGHLVRRWRKELGGDDAMVALLQSSEHPIAQHMPARVGEVVEATGRPFETLRTLADWKARGLLRDRFSEPPERLARQDAPVQFRSGTHDQAEPPIASTPQKRSGGGMFIGVLIVLVLGIVGLWFVTRGEVPPAIPGIVP